MRKTAGWALTAAGALLLLGVGGEYAVGAVRADRARQEWEAIEAHRALDQTRRSVQFASLARQVPDGSPVAHLLIPKIGLDEIVLEGVDGDDLNAGPGHVPGSAFPGEPGNAVISAHRDRHFSRFGELSTGDTIATESNGHRDLWVIQREHVIDKDAPALFRTADATLTLTTCWPIRYLGSAPERLIITAKPVRSTHPASRAADEWMDLGGATGGP